MRTDGQGSGLLHCELATRHSTTDAESTRSDDPLFPRQTECMLEAISSCVTRASKRSVDGNTGTLPVRCRARFSILPLLIRGPPAVLDLFSLCMSCEAVSPVNLSCGNQAETLRGMEIGGDCTSSTCSHQPRTTARGYTQTCKSGKSIVVSTRLVACRITGAASRE